MFRGALFYQRFPLRFLPIERSSDQLGVMQQPDIANALEIEVGLYLIGDFAPDVIGRQFDVVPVLSIVKGSERRPKRTGALLGLNREATWGFTSGQVVKSNEISDHVKWLIEKSSAASGTVNHNVRAFFEISMGAGTSCVIPGELLAFAKELDAEIGIVARSYHAA